MTESLFAGTMPITIAAQIACVEREIKMREHVYPRRVADCKMSQAKADDELAAMRAVLATLKDDRYGAGFRAARAKASAIVVAETDGDSPFDGTLAHMADAIDRLMP